MTIRQPRSDVGLQVLTSTGQERAPRVGDNSLLSIMKTNSVVNCFQIIVFLTSLTTKKYYDKR